MSAKAFVLDKRASAPDIALKQRRGILKADFGFEPDCNAHGNVQATFSEKG